MHSHPDSVNKPLHYYHQHPLRKKENLRKKRGKKRLKTHTFLGPSWANFYHILYTQKCLVSGHWWTKLKSDWKMWKRSCIVTDKSQWVNYIINEVVTLSVCILCSVWHLHLSISRGTTLLVAVVKPKVQTSESIEGEITFE